MRPLLAVLLLVCIACATAGRSGPHQTATTPAGPSETEMELMAAEVRIGRAVDDLRQYLAQHPDQALERIICVLAGDLPRDHSDEVWSEYLRMK